MFKIKLRVFGFDLDDICFACERDYHRFGMIDADLYENDDKIGALCDKCLKSVFKLSSILRGRAKYLRVRAKYLEKMADEGIRFPNKEEFERAIRECKEFEPSYRKEWGPEYQKEWEEEQEKSGNENKSEDGAEQNKPPKPLGVRR